MQKFVSTVNPALRSLNYLLLTTLLMLVAVLLGVYLIEGMGYEVVVSGDMRQAAIPFALAASTTMFLSRRFRKED